MKKLIILIFLISICIN